jgi:hypothetical protein
MHFMKKQEFAESFPRNNFTLLKLEFIQSTIMFFSFISIFLFLSGVTQDLQSVSL